MVVALWCGFDKWNHCKITIMISSFSYFIGIISCYTLHALFNF